MKLSTIGAAILAALAITGTASAQSGQAAISLKLDDLKQAITHIEQSDNQAGAEVSLSIRNDRLRLSSDHRLVAPGVLSFDVYRVGATQELGVFDNGGRVALGELKAQLNQAKTDSIKISGHTITHLAQLRGLVQSLAVADSAPVEFNLASTEGNVWSFAVPSSAPASARVFALVNYEENKAK